MLINVLYEANLITKKLFAFSFSSSTNSADNFLDIGTYSTTNMRDASELVWIDALPDFWWVNTIEGIKFGEGHNLNDAYILSSYRASLDTGSTCTYIPYQHYSWIMQQILKDVKGYYYIEAGWGYYFPCSELDKLQPV